MYTSGECILLFLPFKKINKTRGKLPHLSCRETMRISLGYPKLILGVAQNVIGCRENDHSVMTAQHSIAWVKHFLTQRHSTVPFGVQCMYSALE
uniref:Uncharacterized protein n=1 Tax=Anguilla anguilla TaxID=7936 RepID=A0A0E9X7R5_ANGAN